MRNPLGVYYNQQTGLFEAHLGVRKIGEYQSQFEAMNAYNELSSKIFNFPILNKLDVEENSIDNEQIKWYDKAIEERKNDKKEGIEKENGTEEKQEESDEKSTLEILAKNLNSNE